MEKMDFAVTLSPREAVERVQRAVEGSFSGELLDTVIRSLPDGKESILLLFEKYYMRSNNRATLTFFADNFEGKTQVHLSAGGGGEGTFFRFDWGAGASFSELAKNALREFICN